MTTSAEPAGTAVWPRSPDQQVTMSVAEGRCINLRGRLKACDLCQRVCHTAAITLTLDRVAVDAAACVGCGACVPACPAGALAHDAFDPEGLLEVAIEDGVARIGCRQSPGDGAPIPCHRILDTRVMAALFAEGAERIELVGPDACHGCPSGDARPALKAAVRDLEKWFGEAAPAVVVVSERHRANGDAEAETRRAVGRRKLLRGALETISDALPDPPGIPRFDALAADEDTGGELAARPVPHQQVMARRRAELPFRQGGQTGATGRQIGEVCSGCMVCADLCPTGALGGEAEATHRLISFDPALCTNCTLCLKVCPMDAVSAKALRGVAAATAGRAVLFARAAQTCGECGAVVMPVAGGGALCTDCKNDCELDEEWLEMLSG